MIEMEDSVIKLTPETVGPIMDYDRFMSDAEQLRKRFNVAIDVATHECLSSIFANMAQTRTIVTGTEDKAVIKKAERQNELNIKYIEGKHDEAIKEIVVQYRKDYKALLKKYPKALVIGHGN